MSLFKRALDDFLLWEAGLLAALFVGVSVYQRSLGWLLFLPIIFVFTIVIIVARQREKKLGGEPNDGD